MAILGAALVLVAGVGAGLLLSRNASLPSGDPSWRPIWVATDPEVVQHGDASYPIAAGLMGETSPLVSLVVPWHTSQALMATGRTPAVAVARDTFVFATDDGTAGRVTAVSLGDDPTPRTVLETRHVVSQVAIAPDTLTTFALLLDRESLAPLGVWMVANRADQAARQVMGPPVPLVAVDGVRLAARSMVGDTLLTDGQWLVRESCIDSGLVCALDAMDLVSGATTQLPRTEFARGPNLQLAGGVLVYRQCQDLRCPDVGLTLATGVSQNLPGVGQGGYLTQFDGRVLYVYGADVDANLSAHRLDAYDLAAAESRILWVAPAGASVFAWPIPGSSRVDGTITVGVGNDDGGGSSFTLLDLASLQVREIPQPRYPWFD